MTACDGGDSKGSGGESEGAGGRSRGAARESPKATAQTTDPGARAGIKGARAALQAFLRGQAAGDPSVCRYVAELGAFIRGPALQGDCPRGVRDTPHLVRPAEREALRTVVVRGGRLAGDEALIPFSALHWTSGHMRARTLQDQFTLRRDGEIWQIVN